ncbi:hypothetical protein HMPREF1555_02090 [Porphyromonas gingivalis F0570]|uniref:Uncharacterized protein n=1 Tax=Porphyromonas gingivalis F0570 TaxID=1227271 RepID=A0A0E2M2V2_PORGN|nr:hypothetical protein HMPREF1555_02090 [Porphyromonas gingivalis F0570]
MVLEGSTISFERIHRTGVYNPSEDSAGNKLFLVLQRLHTENRGCKITLKLIKIEVQRCTAN